MFFKPFLWVLAVAILMPVTVRSETHLIEAEEFAAAGGGWRRQAYGDNYYVGTFADTFLSRKAFLGADEQSEGTAEYSLSITNRGKFLALVRYEAAFGFETQFKLQIEQNGKRKLDRLYGARGNTKVWPFGKRLTNEVAWDWGASENIVWEGHDAAVELEPGPAVIKLIAIKQPAPAARRNIDLVMLTDDIAQVQKRIGSENYLPLDGMLTQAGDLYLKVKNLTSAPLELNILNGTEHSPYWVHKRDWQPKSVLVQPQQESDWIEVGSLLDSLNDGQWTISSKGTNEGPFSLQFAAPEKDGRSVIRKFENITREVSLAYDADTRYTKRIRATEEVLRDLVSYLEKRPVKGRAPTKTLIYGTTFAARPKDSNYTKELDRFIELMGATALSTGSKDFEPAGDLIRGYIDVRDQNPAQLEATCRKLVAEGRAAQIATVSLGDEIGLPGPSDDVQESFRQWEKTRQLKAAEVDPTAGEDWSKVNFKPGLDSKTNPRLFYYSHLFEHAYGIRKEKELTETINSYLPNALVGANFSPHHGNYYLGETHKWVSLFREGGMTMPWSEDYIFQVPVGSEQMNFLSVDLFRAGIKTNPRAKIHFYIMPHWPGTTPAAWRRQFYGDIAHGTKVVNLFEFRPVQVAYTENHCSSPEMYQEIRKAFHELGTFEDIVQEGKVAPGVAGIWFSETADIWNDYAGSFAAGKRTLYIAAVHQQLPLDVVVEGDDLSSYKVIYVADRHVSRAASSAIAEWVEKGGRLITTAGAGMFDEFNEPNSVMSRVLGIEQKSVIESKIPVKLEKQDLPFAEAIGKVKTDSGEFSIYGVETEIETKTAKALGFFGQNSAAITLNKSGKGEVMYFAFLPGLTYFKPALPMRPVDRSSRDDALCHFIPVKFDQGIAKFFDSITHDIERPVRVSEPLVETTRIVSAKGTLISLNNWSGGPRKNLKVMVSNPPAFKEATLASGEEVKFERQGDKAVFILILDVADGIILR